MKQNNHHHNQPLVRMVKRTDLTRGKSILIRVLPCWQPLSPGTAHRPLGEKSGGGIWPDGNGGPYDASGPTETIRIAIPLLITSLGVALAFKMKFWNIGAEGQICLGAIAATYFALFYADKIPGAVFVPGYVLGRSGLRRPVGVNSGLFQGEIQYQ